MREIIMTLIFRIYICGNCLKLFAGNISMGDKLCMVYETYVAYELNMFIA